MKCAACKYQYERKSMSMVLNKEDATIGDQPFISLGQTLAHDTVNMESYFYPMVACPKCGTLKLDI